MLRSQQDEDQDKGTDLRGLPVTTSVFLDGEPVLVLENQQECFKSSRVPIEGHRYDS
jgi:hypothetical protein